MIPIAKLLTGHVYRVTGRNIGPVAVWADAVFCGIREEWDGWSLEYELHWDAHGTARPLEDLGPSGVDVHDRNALWHFLAGYPALVTPELAPYVSNVLGLKPAGVEEYVRGLADEVDASRMLEIEHDVYAAMDDPPYSSYTPFVDAGRWRVVMAGLFYLAQGTQDVPSHPNG